MKRPLALLAVTLFGLPIGLPAQVGKGLLDPNSASDKQLAELDGMTAAITAAMVKARPFTNALALDAFLGEQGLDPAARGKIYGKAFLHINLNTASSKEMQLIPGVGRRMAHEFDEYRPWKSFKQFDKEIGKYVSKTEVARFKQYCFIPLDLNKASDADFQTIPGVGKRMAHEFEEYRPWKSKKQFEREIGKYVNAKEVARFWRYMTIK
ncbi:MAG: hypothetical protein CMJ90_13680 [Planctomycetes bacterium]|nr:hypothetical protein [Planctomycetota bacterium]